ncbi:hypothetical protein [Achromobacter sp. ACRQX]|uniref:hypothetical protein n=1 Tax=Achromobacter sp. ACRQX TaxID=2918181 RepID=UPI001EF225CB|nr:hypothetical protein [Achromobacter sp. ACRQX]MCG7326844.1 hypothetical protein [Achromobacter sp. ACRQX]
MAARYSHAFTLGFELETESADGEDATGAQLRVAILSLLQELTDAQLVAACGAPFDSHEVGQ